MHCDSLETRVTTHNTKVVVYNNKYFRVFTKGGAHVGGGNFSSLSLPSDVLFMKFFSDSLNVSVHWSGDQVNMSNKHASSLAALDSTKAASQNITITASKYNCHG